MTQKRLFRREYTLTAGGPADSRIVARVKGPVEPGLAVLEARFNRQFLIPLDHAQTRLRDAGYAIERCGGEVDYASIFLTWLIRQHDYHIIDSDEYRFGRA